MNGELKSNYVLNSAKVKCEALEIPEIVHCVVVARKPGALECHKRLVEGRRGMKSKINLTNDRNTGKNIDRKDTVIDVVKNTSCATLAFVVGAINPATSSRPVQKGSFRHYWGSRDTIAP